MAKYCTAEVLRYGVLLQVKEEEDQMLFRNRKKKMWKVRLDSI